MSACPFIMAGLSADPKVTSLKLVDIEPQFTCREEDCMWWDFEESTCVVCTISYFLGQIAKLSEKIK
jgi:hypothetical protein